MIESSNEVVMITNLRAAITAIGLFLAAIYTMIYEYMEEE